MSQEYLQMLESGCSQEVKDYLAAKLRQVEEVQAAIEQRGAMLLDLAKCLLEVQEGFSCMGRMRSGRLGWRRRQGSCLCLALP